MRSEGLGFQTVWVFLLNINTLSHGSEGFVIFMYQKIKLNINTLSHGSEEYLVVANSFDDCIN